MEAEFSFEIGAMPPEGDAEFEDFWTAFQREAMGRRGDESDSRRSTRNEIAAAFGAGLTAMELLHETAVESINWASDLVNDALDEDNKDLVFAEYFNVLVGLGGRALLVFDEVTWLLRGGYPRGAWSRVRSLQELFVVATTLGVHGNPDGDHPDLIERYIRHHEVFTRSIADDLLATETDTLVETLNSDVLDVLERKKLALIEKFGKAYRGAWGWAAQVVPPGSTASFTSLSKLILPAFNAHYGIASVEVHASSQGLNDAASRTENGERYYLAGAEKNGLSAPATLASGFLVGILGSIVPITHRPDREAELSHLGHYFLGALVRIQRQIHTGFGDGDSAEQEDSGESRLS